MHVRLIALEVPAIKARPQCNQISIWADDPISTEGAFVYTTAAMFREETRASEWLVNDSKANAFRFAFSKGFVAYTQNGPLRAGSQAGSGGVAVLVRRGFPQKAKFSKDGCQGMFILGARCLFRFDLFRPSWKQPPHRL